jgi:hypothetical protein
MRSCFPTRLATILAALCGLSVAAEAQTITWCFTADGNQEVPPVATNATADAVVQLDTATNMLSWSVTHQGLTGSHNATHFHGPAAPGQNAGIQVNVGTGNPIVGSAFITAGQAADLQAGLWYINLHTSAFGNGEIRGQVTGVCSQTLCTSLANSFDASGARLDTLGDFVAGNNAITLTASGVPPSQFGYLLISQFDTVTMPATSSGQLCIAGGPIGRYNNQILVADAGGVLGPFTPDILTLPNPPGGSVTAGSTWNFQAWFRDGLTNNFTDALEVTFL